MADSESKKTSKRRLKAPGDTVREQAEKAQAAADTPSRGSRRLKTAADATQKSRGLIAKVFDRQPFRFIGLIIFPRFMRNAFGELKLVTWPNRRETTRLTIAVIIFAIIFGVTITIVDYGLDKIFRAIIIEN